MTATEVRAAVFKDYKLIRSKLGEPALPRAKFLAAMDKETKNATAADGTIDGSDLEAAFIRVCSY